VRCKSAAPSRVGYGPSVRSGAKGGVAKNLGSSLTRPFVDISLPLAMPEADALAFFGQL
jgi:hypothetical protein